MYWLNKIISILDKVGVFSRWTNIAGLAALFSMVLVTFVDVFMRYIFNRPIKGVLEITEVIMICAIFLAVAHTYDDKGHVCIDVITSKLSDKAKTIMEFMTTLIGVGIFVIIVWQVLEVTILFLEDRRIHSQLIMIPSGPFAAVIALGCTSVLLLVIRDLLRNAVEAVRLGLTRYNWILMIGLPIIFIIASSFWVQSSLWNLSKPTVGLIGIIFSFALFLSGMPVALVLILTSFLFISNIRGVNAGLDMIGTDFYRTTGSYSWSVLPFFVLMGFFCLFGKFGEDLYYAAYRWLGHLRGGLAVSTIGASTAFAAVVGDPIASVATMGTTALPEMRKYHYDDHLSAGSIIGGASIGPVVPPSVPFVIYGLLTGVSIGGLLLAGLIPGIIMAFCFILIIYVWCRLYPNAGPAGEKSGWIQRIVSLRAGGPVLLLFILVIGGIYMGVFTPTEGGSIGAVVSLTIALIMRRYTWKIFAHALAEAGKVVSMTFLILIGALMFSRFMAWCNIQGTATELIKGLGLSPNVFVVIMLIMVFILGFVIDILPLLLIGVPIVHPIAVSLGIDPIWFAVLMVLTINLGDLTPPIGVVLFTLKVISKDLPIVVIFKGVMPFVLATMLAIILIYLFPALATWLPGLRS
ncbi:MAG: TRAP transporter large permease subunit [Deltaproteobacteria bacterium]|nr:TRAP transporter large permease subunit [Deltaproteobacteria bacterium]